MAWLTMRLRKVDRVPDPTCRTIPLVVGINAMKIATLILLSSISSAGVHAAPGENVTCESRNNERTHCRVPGDGAVRVDFVLSEAPCIENRSWWRTSTGIEVDNGCRAIFSTTAAEPEPPNRNTYIDLVDTDAAGARATLLDRGYTFVRSREIDGTQHHYFRTPGRPACLRAVERGGRYRDLDATSAEECR
jgi:hypothetical protein